VPAQHRSTASCSACPGSGASTIGVGLASNMPSSSVSTARAPLPPHAAWSPRPCSLRAG
jgi:hypothetical protein